MIEGLQMVELYQLEAFQRQISTAQRVLLLLSLKLVALYIRKKWLFSSLLSF